MLLLAGAGQLGAQSFDFGFKHLTTDNGLTHDNVFDITKDKRGFLWFATMNGLNRYDGMQFRQFFHDPKDSATLSNNFVTTIVCDSAGYVWAGTRNGVCRFDPHTQTFRRLHFPDKSERNTSYIALSRDGRLFAVRNLNVYAIDLQKMTAAIIRPLAADAESARFFPAAGNNLWLRIRQALYLFDTKTFQAQYVMGVDDNHPLARPGVTHVYTDPQEKTWIGTWEAGLYRYNEQTKTGQSCETQTPFVVSMGADLQYAENNLLWMSAGYSGLMLWNTKTGRIIEMPKHVQQPWSHNGSRIHVFYRDSTNGIMWIGSEFGVEKYDPNTEHFARKMIPATGIVGQFPSVNAVWQDITDTSGRTFWISCWVSGLYKWNRATDEMTSYSAPLRTNEVFGLTQDNDGNLWIAEWRGVQVFNPRTNQWKLIDSFIRHDTVSSKVLHLLKDSRGNIWMAPNYNGLFKYDWQTKKIIRYDVSTALDKQQRLWVSGLAEDRQGNIWVTAGYHTFSIAPSGAIAELKLKQPERFNLKTASGLSIAVDRYNTLWVSSWDKLLNITTAGDIIRVYDQNNGLKGAVLHHVLCDAKGFIWLATENSLHRLDPETGHFRYYKKEDGLFNNNISEPINLTPGGELFVGFHNAFSYTNINKLNHRITNVPFIFTHVQVEDRVISPIDVQRVTLQPGENSMDISFAALDYSKPEKIQYAWWMEGLDKQWHFTPQRTLNFTNLAGGHYTLHVKVMGPNGVISKEELTLQVRVIPPFYRTWWFWLLMMLAAGGIFFAYLYIRRQQRHRLEKIRERIATDLHDDMGSTLSSIRIFSDVARGQIASTQPEVVPMLEKISHNASQLSDNMQDIIWTIKQDHDKLEDLVARIREFGLKLCDARDITFKVHISDSFKSSRLNLEQRRNLYLIFKETLNNAIKYAGCTVIQLFITQQRGHLKMVIEDNGNGFRQENITRGNGLSNIKKRAQEINGSATIESYPGKGTRIDVLVKLA